MKSCGFSAYDKLCAVVGESAGGQGFRRPNPIDAESDSTLRVFEGWWHGRHFARIVRNCNGNLNVPYLYENGDKVVLNWNYLVNDWNGNNPGLRHASGSFIVEHRRQSFSL